VVQLLLGAVAMQLERAGSNDDNEDSGSLMPQLISVLATCNQFSPETVHNAMAEQDASHRKLLVGALQAAPNPRLMALGASAAEQETMEKAGHLAGSAIRAASRGRDASPKPDSRQSGQSGQSSDSRSMRPPPGPLPAMDKNGLLRRSDSRLPRAEDGQRGPSGSPPIAGSRKTEIEGSPKRRTHRRQRSEGPNLSPAPGGNDLGTSILSEASTTASAEARNGDFDDSRDRGGRQRFPKDSAASSSSSNLRWSPDGGQRPPAPMELSTALGNGRAKYSFKDGGRDGEGDFDAQWRNLARSGSSEGRLTKTKENGDSLAALMDCLSSIKTDNNQPRTR